jgi:rod shape determining protein RodA
VLVALHGEVGKGAQRWIDIGPLQLAAFGADEDHAGAGPRRLVPPGELGAGGQSLFLVIPPIIAALVPVGLILKQPNLGTGMITLMVGRRSVFWAAGVRWWKFAGDLAAWPARRPSL